MPALSPGSHVNLADVRDFYAVMEFREGLRVRVGDSRSTYGGESVRSALGEALRQYNVKWAALHSHGMSGNNGARDGLGQNLIGLTGITNTEIGMGATGAGSGLVNSLPVKLLSSWVTSTPNNPHFGRYIDIQCTAGGSMDSTNLSASTGGNFKRGDPAQGRNIQSVTRFAVTNTTAGVWIASRTSFGYAGNYQTHGPTNFSAPPAASSGLLITPEVMTHGTSTGAQVSVWHRHITNPSVGTGTIWAGTEIRFGDSGMNLFLAAEGGWSTTDHLPETTAGRPTNTDWKYTDAGMREVLTKMYGVGSRIIDVEIDVCLGQNGSVLAGYQEWDGTSLNFYGQNIEQVADRWVNAARQCGAINVLVRLTTPWQSGVDSARISAIREVLRGIANRRRWAFFDTQAELLAGGYSTNASGLADAYTAHADLGNNDRIHAGFAGMNLLGTLEWEALSTAATQVAVGGLAPRSNRAGGPR